MSELTTTSTFDVAALRRAFSDRDSDALLALYADDASIELVDAEHPPSQPRRIEGREAIGAHIRDVFGRDLVHELDIVAVGDGALGYSLRCAYSDGTRVLCAGTSELRDGKIVREVGVQAWDA
jgi:ketosteroid isomerase-like protein